MSDTKQKQIEWYVKKMQRCVQEQDTEAAHADADDLLCELLTKLGFDKVIETYNQVSKWYA